MHISHKTDSLSSAPAVVIFGCGNVLLGDDGFGPAVITRLLENNLPSSVLAVDVGTGIREYLLDYLMLPELRPSMLIVVDVDVEGVGSPGEVRMCSPNDLPARKIHDFSLHQFPTVNLLQELQEATGVTVAVLLARPPVPVDGFALELSPEIRAAVEPACQQICRLIAPFVPRETAQS
ncbi:MAG: hydrogenase maturation protease [Desulfobulbus sp.]|nr:hydrogenase maturation protease [Desulfobulbus sp.]